MSTQPVRIVDAHVHWWDPRNAWMAMPTQEVADQLNMGRIGQMLRPYGPDDYRQDSAGHRVDKVVWVMVNANDAGHVAEVEWVRDRFGGDPLLGAMIGSVDPKLDGAGRRASLEAQLAVPQFRGVRILGELEYGTSSAGDYMRMLAEHGLVFDHMGHHETMADAARLAEAHPGVPWILEHCGWPLAPSDSGYVEAWKQGIHALASVETVHCKLSGLAMATHGFDDAQRPLLEHCLEEFGPERCLFGSNFPVDGNYGTYDALVTMFRSVIGQLPEQEQSKILAGNTERVYRIG